MPEKLLLPIGTIVRSSSYEHTGLRENLLAKVVDQTGDIPNIRFIEGSRALRDNKFLVDPSWLDAGLVEVVL